MLIRLPVHRTLSKSRHHSLFTSPLKAQPAFNRQFDLLIQGSERLGSKKDLSFILFAENPKQLERLQIIFEDLKAEYSFQSSYLRLFMKDLLMRI